MQWAHSWLGVGAEVLTALSALGPGLLQLSYLSASCVSLYLKVFLSSCLSRAEVHTLEACVGVRPYPHANQKTLLNIPRTSFSISHRLCSQALALFHTLLDTPPEYPFYSLPCLSQALPQFLLFYSSSWSHMLQSQ